MKLHRNLGHPSNADLVRVLKHGQASEEAIKLARDLTQPGKLLQLPTLAKPALSLSLTSVLA